MGNVLLYALGAAFRYSVSGVNFVQHRPEISNPTNSWKRLIEGVHLSQMGQSPYDGVLFHESPLLLQLYTCMEYILVDNSVLMSIILDLITCFIMSDAGYYAAALMLRHQKLDKGEVHPESGSLLLSSNLINVLPKHIAVFYMLNPFLIVNCAARTTTLWNNLFLALALLGLTLNNRWLGTLAVSLAAYQTMYPIILIFPLAIHFASCEGSEKKSYVRSVLETFMYTAFWLAALLYASFLVTGSWAFINSTYGFILTVPELTPNMGIYWYFFTEMFEHFRSFFLGTFQLNMLMYCIPLSIRFWRSPLLLFGSFVGLIAVFKSYPGLGDVGFFLSLLPFFPQLLPFFKQTISTVGLLVATTMLAPVLWQLWIYNNSANANYYFAINLLYSSALIFILTDLLLAQVRRDFYLKNGHSVIEKLVNGKKMILQLK